MLTLDKMTSKHTQKLLDLIENHARLEIISRMGEIPSDVRISTVNDTVDALDDLRTFVFGTCDMVELAYEFGILKRGNASSSKKKKVKVKVKIKVETNNKKKKKIVKKKIARKRHILDDDEDNILGDILGRN